MNNNPKNNKETTQRLEVLNSILDKYQLDLETKFSSKPHLTIKKNKDKKIYSGYLEDIEQRSVSDFYIGIEAFYNVLPHTKKIKDKYGDEIYQENYDLLKNTLLKEIILETKKVIKPQSYLKYLDKKISSSKYNKDSDVKWIINFLVENDNEHLFSYINRPKILTSHYLEVIPMAFPHLNESQKENIFIDLLNIDTLKNTNNKNKIYKLIKDQLKNPEKFYDYFEHIQQKQEDNFIIKTQKSIAIKIDRMALNSYNLENRDYSSIENLDFLLKRMITKLSEHKDILGYESFLFGEEKQSDTIYFQGEHINENILTQCINFSFKKALSKNSYRETYDITISNAEIMNIVLENDLKVSETKTSKFKI